jgi:hypothetical protein
MYAFDIRSERKTDREPLSPKLKPLLWLTHGAFVVLVLAHLVFTFLLWSQSQENESLRAILASGQAEIQDQLGGINRIKGFRNQATEVRDWINGGIHTEAVVAAILGEISITSQVWLDQLELRQSDGIGEATLKVLLEGDPRAAGECLTRADRSLARLGFRLVRSASESVTEKQARGPSRNLVRYTATYKTPALNHE